MEKDLVKDIMVPLSGYAMVSEEATLFDAIVALEEAQKKFEPTSYKHRAVLIHDKNKKIVGKVSQLDILRALEPKYEQMGDPKSLSRFGFSAHFLKTLMSQFSILDKPLDDICKKAGAIKVKDFMYTPTEGEYVNENASINEAIHQVVMGHHQSLLVTKENEIVGILRLTDIFQEISNRIKVCEL